MHQPARRSPDRLLTATARVAAVTLIGLACAVQQRSDALGIGETPPSIELGQALSLTVPIRATKDEASYLGARLVGVATSTDRITDLPTLEERYQTSVETDARGQPVVRISSRTRVMEPYLEFTLEVYADGLRVQRQFTVMADPAGMTTPYQDLPEPATLVAQAAPAPAVTRVAAHVRVARAPAITGPSAFYTVGRGDTLASIARLMSQTLPLTVAQIESRLFHANPQAFGGSPHLMYAGARLQLEGIDAPLGAADTMLARRAPRTPVTAPVIEIAKAPATGVAPVAIAPQAAAPAARAGTADVAIAQPRLPATVPVSWTRPSRKAQAKPRFKAGFENLEAQIRALKNLADHPLPYGRGGMTMALEPVATVTSVAKKTGGLSLNSMVMIAIVTSLLTAILVLLGQRVLQPRRRPAAVRAVPVAEPDTVRLSDSGPRLASGLHPAARSATFDPAVRFEWSPEQWQAPPSATPANESSDENAPFRLNQQEWGQKSVL